MQRFRLTPGHSFKRSRIAWKRVEVILKFTASLVDLYKATHKPKAIAALWKDPRQLDVHLNHWFRRQREERHRRKVESDGADLTRLNWYYDSTIVFHGA